MRNRTVSVALFWAILVQTFPIHAQNQANPPEGKLRIVIVEGDGAINNVRQRVSREPIVQVEDENRKPVAGAIVTFFLPNQGAGASFTNGAQSLTITTDAQGRAVARGLRPNNVNGQYEIRVTASHQGQVASASISQTNSVTAVTGSSSSGGLSAKWIAILAVAGGAAAAGAAVAITRGGGNNGNGIGPTSPTVIVPGSPTVGGPQ